MKTIIQQKDAELKAFMDEHSERSHARQTEAMLQRNKENNDSVYERISKEIFVKGAESASLNELWAQGLLFLNSGAADGLETFLKVNFKAFSGSGLPFFFKGALHFQREEYDAALVQRKAKPIRKSWWIISLTMQRM